MKKIKKNLIINIKYNKQVSLLFIIIAIQRNSWNETVCEKLSYTMHVRIHSIRNDLIVAFRNEWEYKYVSIALLISTWADIVDISPSSEPADHFAVLGGIIRKVHDTSILSS
jgi:hypothetical protein